MKTIKRMGVILLIGAVSLIAVAASAGNNEKGKGNGPVVYVTSQDLYFDSIVIADLPFKGEFQQLTMGGMSGLMTDLGPGDVGYLGGRWWIDLNSNNFMDDEDMYFLCPLLGPGRNAP